MMVTVHCGRDYAFRCLVHKPYCEPAERKVRRLQRHVDEQKPRDVFLCYACKNAIMAHERAKILRNAQLPDDFDLNVLYEGWD